LCVWLSVGLSLAGFGLTLRSIEARVGRLSLDQYHGLYGHIPSLAGLFLLTGLASIGFPGTAGFVGVELLVEGAVQVSPFVGIAIVVAAALNGLAVLHAYFRIFTGSRHVASIDLRIRFPERVAVLVLSAMLLGGGLYPQPGVAGRYNAAAQLVKERERRLGDKVPSAGSSDDFGAASRGQSHPAAADFSLNRLAANLRGFAGCAFQPAQREILLLTWVVGEDVARLELIDPGVQMDRAAGPAGGDGRQRLQVLDLHEHVFLDRGHQEFVGREVAVVLANDLPRRLAMRQPALHRWHLGDDWRIEQGLDRPAVGVAADDNVLYAQPGDGKLDGGRLARRRRAVRRDDVARVSQNKQIAGERMGEQIGIDTRVGTGDEQRLRLLAVDQFLIQVVKLAKVFVLKLVDALDQIPHGFRSLAHKVIDASGNWLARKPEALRRAGPSASHEPLETGLFRPRRFHYA
jgi:hypothetical protein